MIVNHMLVDQMEREDIVCFFFVIGSNQSFSDSINPEKAGSDQKKQADAGKNQNLAFQIGLAENPFDGPIGHATKIQGIQAVLEL